MEGNTNYGFIKQQNELNEFAVLQWLFCFEWAKIHHFHANSFFSPRPNIWWMKPSAGRCNGHAKAANLISKLHIQDVPYVSNGQYRLKELNQGFSMVFFPSALLWSLRKLSLKFSLIFLLGTTKVLTSGFSTCLGPADGIWYFKIHKTSNDCQVC